MSFETAPCFVLKLLSGELGIFESEDHAFHYAESLNLAQRREWAFSKDQKLWYPLQDWHRMKTTQSDFQAEALDLQDRRIFPRYDLRLQINLISACRSYASYTKNISEGGLQLERQIPLSFQNEICKIQIICPKNRELVQLTGNVKIRDSLAQSLEFQSITKGKLIPLLIHWVRRDFATQKKAS